jgi:23S rRNA pseudouridine2605 synthase
VGGRERVCVDGRVVKLSPEQARAEHQHLAYYKNAEPRGDSGNEDSEPLLELPRPRHGRWIDAGALDPNTSGLIILTTDGELAFRLTRPATLVEREYAVRVLGEPSAEQLRDLEDGVQLDDGVARLASIEHAGGAANNRWYHVVLREGRHRELRAALGAVGLAVNRVIRVRFGPIELGKLRRGASRPLSPQEVDGLYGLAGLTPPKQSHAKRDTARAGTPTRSHGSRSRAQGRR